MDTTYKTPKRFAREHLEYTTGLAKEIVKRLNKDNQPRNHPLRKMAVDFDEKSIQYFQGKLSAAKYLGCWAKVRKAWCDYSGEDLI